MASPKSAVELAEELERAYQAGKRGKWERQRDGDSENAKARKSTRSFTANRGQYSQRHGTFTLRVPNWAITFLDSRCDVLDISRNQLICELLMTWIRLQTEGDSELLPLVPRGVLRGDLPSHLDPSPPGLEDSYG